MSLAWLAIAGAAAAVDVAPAEQGVTAYPPEFFAAASPSTAYDMVIRLPGFAFDKGQAVRGLAGAGGNVLIDGEPPVAKNDTLDEVLKRIPAAAVARVELIRGGAPGIDMQGRTVIANVVKASRAGLRGSTTDGAYFTGDGRTLSSFRAELQWRGAGGQAAEFSTVYGYGPDDVLGDGVRVRYGPDGRVLIRSDVDADGEGLRVWNTGAFETPLAGGRLRINGAYMLSPYDAETTDRLEVPGGREYQYDTNDRRQAEIGGRYTRDFGPKAQLEAIAFQQWNDARTRSRFEGPGLTRFFDLDKDTTETVGRLTGRYRPAAALTFEVAAEGALNKLDSVTAFLLNGAPVALPAANVGVEEKRGELRALATWRPTATLTLEAGGRYERSTITSRGDTALEKSLRFLKPRAALTWSPDARNQVRLRLEREVGQLNFDDFVANSSVANTGQVIAGNPDIAPQQAWVAEVAYERRFWTSGSASLTLRHSELTDVIDRVPVFGLGGAVADAPGNIGDGTRDEAILAVSLPLDRLGVKAAQLKGQGTWRRTRVDDPLTGERREISGARPVEWELHFTQDLPAWRVVWGFDVNRGANDISGGRERYFRLSEVETRKYDTWVTLFGEYKPRADLTLRLELMNATERGFTRIREVYAGPRDRTPLLYTDVRDLTWNRVINVRIRKTFD